VAAAQRTGVSFKHRVKEDWFPQINRVLGKLSIKIASVNDPNRDFTAFVRHLERQGMTFASVIDVGVAFGTTSLYKSMPKAQFYLVEPVPSCGPFLERMAREYGAKVFNVAAGDADGEIEFFVHPDVSGSSALRQVEGERFDGMRHTVPVRRLDSLIPANMPGPVMLKIDTQGYELPVIDGARGLMDRLDVVIVECSFHAFRHGAPEVSDVIRKMGEYGFVPYEILEGHYRPVDGALAQVDVAFVPEQSPLRREKGVFSQAQLDQYLDA
jgi:FkbM family methyltransferase